MYKKIFIASLAIFMAIGFPGAGAIAATTIGTSIDQTAIAPVQVGSIADSSNAVLELDNAEAVVVTGDLAFVASWVDDGVQILDISQPSNPVHISSINTGDFGLTFDAVSDVVVAGKYLYFSSYATHTIHIFDISNPASPTPVGSITDTASTYLRQPQEMQISGKYLYVTSWLDDALSIIDVSDPTSPQVVGSLVDDGTAEMDGPHSFTVVGDYAYIAGYNDDGFEIIDISDPTNPIHAGKLEDTVSLELDGAANVYVRGKYAYVTANVDDGFQIIDISDPSSPTGVAAITDDSTTELDGAKGIVVAGNYAYINAENDDGIQVIDISNPSNPVAVAAIDNDADTLLDRPNTQSQLMGKYFYVPVGIDDGFVVLEMAGIEAPTATIGSLDTDLLYVSGDSILHNNLIVGSGLSVGSHGILTAGSLGVSGTTTASYFGGSVGIGTSTPQYPIHLASGAHVTTGGTWTDASDERLKFDIVDSPYGLAEILQLSPKQYKYKADNSLDIGFVAQDILEVMPELVSGADSESMLGLKYSHMTAVLTKAIQEQQAQIQSLALGGSLQGNLSANLTADTLVVSNRISTVDLAVRGHASFSSDVVGAAVIEQGDSEVTILFDRAYQQVPIITLTPLGTSLMDHDIDFALAQATTESFTIRLSQAAPQRVEINWHAFARVAGSVTQPSVSAVMAGIPVDEVLTAETDTVVIDDEIVSEQVDITLLGSIENKQGDGGVTAKAIQSEVQSDQEIIIESLLVDTEVVE